MLRFSTTIRHCVVAAGLIDTGREPKESYDGVVSPEPDKLCSAGTEMTTRAASWRERPIGEDSLKMDRD